MVPVCADARKRRFLSACAVCWRRKRHATVWNTLKNAGWRQKIHPFSKVSRSFLSLSVPTRPALSHSLTKCPKNARLSQKGERFLKGWAWKRTSFRPQCRSGEIHLPEAAKGDYFCLRDFRANSRSGFALRVRQDARPKANSDGYVLYPALRHYFCVRCAEPEASRQERCHS